MSLILTDIAVQRQVLLERLKTAQVRKFVPILSKIDAEIRRQLGGPRLTDFRRSRLEAQLAGIQGALTGMYREYNDALNKDLRTLATDAGTFEANTFKAYAPTGVSIATPAPNQLWAAATVNPLTMPGANGGSLLEPFMDSWAKGDAEMVTNAIRVGYSLGETNDQIAGRIRGSAALKYSDGVLAKSRSHADTVTRTAIQHVANQARAETWNQNQDIIDEYQWVSTLDSRTSPLCRDRDGQKFPVGKGPLPPAHPNCRSTSVAVIKGDFGRFLDEETERASVNGPVPAGETYYEWLKRQPPDFQDLALGPTRGKLFRDGGLSTEQFSTLQLGKNFEPLSLAEMRATAPAAFAKADLPGGAPALPGVSTLPLQSLPPVTPLSESMALAAWKDKSLTDVPPREDWQAFSSYSGSWFGTINMYLRGTLDLATQTVPDVVDFVRSWVPTIVNRLESTALKQSVNLYRGINANFLIDEIIAKRFDGDKLGKGWEFFDKFKPEDLIGEVFEDSGFMSFSLKKQIAQNFAYPNRGAIVMRLTAREGERGYVALNKEIASTPKEVEIVRKGGRFWITGWDPDEGVLTIEPLP